jgi:hypothetical protein
MLYGSTVTKTRQVFFPLDQIFLNTAQTFVLNQTFLPTALTFVRVQEEVPPPIKQCAQEGQSKKK